METDADPPAEFARQDLTDAIEVALSRDGHLLSAGEHRIAKRFLELPAAAASLYARLFSRRPTVFRTDQLSYAEISDSQSAASVLVAAGFADDERVLPSRLLLELRTVAELKHLCRDSGRRRTGRRSALLERLMEPPPPREAVTMPALALRHQQLFRRLCRLYLHDHSGDLSVVVMTRIGQRTFPAYTPTGGAGLFINRRALLEYEAMRRLRWSLDPAEAVKALPGTLALVAQRRPPEGHRYRFSARRFAVEMALSAARELERQGEHERAAAAYGALLEANIRNREAASRRLAMCLEALGKLPDAVQVCRDGRASASAAGQLALDRTGRRLARKAGLRWVPTPPLRVAPTRELVLEGAQMPGQRPGYASTRGAVPVEQALCSAIRAAGRPVFFGEAAPWSTLFALLCHDAIFAPVPGMLPTTMLHRPLDLGTPGFAARRERWLAPILERIAAGDAPVMLDEALTRLAGVQLAGARWDRFSPELLRELAQGIDGPSLSAVLRCFAADYRASRRGLPDLCVLPGPAIKLPGALPGTLHERMLLAEVKGPGDSLRDEQRVWMHRLLELGVPTELWKVRRKKTAR